jgi:hypothetical protein
MYHCTIDLLFDWFGLVRLANENKNCQLSYCYFQISQTGGQWYSDTSPFVFRGQTNSTNAEAAVTFPQVGRAQT